MKSKNESGRSSVPEKPFEESIAEDMSSACYKFLGWVGFNDKVVSSSSPSKSKHAHTPPPPPQAEVEVMTSSESGGDLDEVGDPDEEPMLVHEKSPSPHPRPQLSHPNLLRRQKKFQVAVRMILKRSTGSLSPGLRMRNPSSFTSCPSPLFHY